MEGGTEVTIHGVGFAPGARAFFSGAEARRSWSPRKGSLSLPARRRKSTARRSSRCSTPTVSRARCSAASCICSSYRCSSWPRRRAALPEARRSTSPARGFHRGAQVFVGGRPATDVQVLSSGRIHIKTPPGDHGPADVLVENPDGKRALAPAAYLYTDLVVASRVGRYDPTWDGPVRPAHRLAQGTPGRVVLKDARAWVLSRATVNRSAQDVEGLRGEHLWRARPGRCHERRPGLSPRRSVVRAPYDPIDLGCRGTIAYVVASGADLPYLELAGEGEPSLLVVDGQDPVAPSFHGAVPFPGEAKGIALAGDLALVAAGTGGSSSSPSPTRSTLCS
jgi:hypothetical protein